MINAQILDWVQTKGLNGLALLVLIGTVSILYRWALRAEPGAAVRALLNYRANQLAKMLERPDLSALTRKRIRLKQRQRDYIFLSGIREPRLADAAVIFTTLYRLRGRYLMPWRRWLQESEGEIIFDEAARNRAWRFYFWHNVPVSTLMLLSATWLFASACGMQTVVPFLLVNTLIFWFPWVMLTAVAPPPMTRMMIPRVNDYNARRSAKP